MSLGFDFFRRKKQKKKNEGSIQICLVRVNDDGPGGWGFHCLRVPTILGDLGATEPLTGANLTSTPYYNSALCLWTDELAILYFASPSLLTSLRLGSRSEIGQRGAKQVGI
jgi:hypothetical protein